MQAIAIRIKRNKKKKDTDPVPVDEGDVFAFSSEEEESDGTSSGSSSGGLQRRSSAVSRRRQLPDNIALASTRNKSDRKEEKDVLDLPPPDLPATPVLSRHRSNRSVAPEEGSDSSTGSISRATRARRRTKKQKRGKGQDGRDRLEELYSVSDPVLHHGPLWLRVGPAAENRWVEQHVVLTDRAVVLFESNAGDTESSSDRSRTQKTGHLAPGVASRPNDCHTLELGGVTVQPSGAGSNSLQRFLLIYKSASTSEHPLELATSDEKAVQQWADLITATCERIRTTGEGATRSDDSDGGAPDEVGISRGSIDRASSQTVLLEGWLHVKKASSGFGSSYKKRWVQLNYKTLSFFDNEKSKTPSEEVSLSFASVKVPVDKKSSDTKQYFDVYAGQKRHELYAESGSLRTQWQAALHGVCSALLSAAAADSKNSRDPVFGVPLMLLMENQRETQSELTVPYPFYCMCEAFRRHNGSKTERVFETLPDPVAFDVYRLAFDEHRFEAEPADAHVAAALIIQFMKELPTPLITQRAFDELADVAAMGSMDDDTTLRRFVHVVERLSQPNQACMVLLMEVLGEVSHADRIEYSKMSAAQLAKIFAPLCVGQAFHAKMLDLRLDDFLETLITGSKTLTSRLGLKGAGSEESTPAKYLRGINGRAVVQEGWLLKRGKLRSKKRWVILEERALHIFDTPQDQWPPKETLNLAGAVASSVENSRTRFVVGDGPNDEAEFEATNGHECEKWLSAIQWKAKLQSESRGEAAAGDVSKVSHADAKAALRLEGNDHCCDCGSENPWLCAVNRGVLLCTFCAKAHQALFERDPIKSLLTLPDGWSPADIRLLKHTGNARVNERLEANLPDKVKLVGEVAHMLPGDQVESFVRRKWLDREFEMSGEVKGMLDTLDSLSPLRTALFHLLTSDPGFCAEASRILAEFADVDSVALEAERPPELEVFTESESTDTLESD